VLTQGIHTAADYIAGEFKKAGLAPADGKNWFQPFTINGSVLEAPATLVLESPGGQVIELKQGTDFFPMGLAVGGKVEAGVVLAGYGVTNTRGKYDDYADVDVTGKVVIVLRDVPRVKEREVSRELRPQAPLSAKLSTAEKKGAKAVLFVNDAETAKSGDDLLDFNFTALSRSSSKLPALHIKRAVVDRMLQTVKKDDSLAEREQAIEKDLRPQSVELTGWTIRLEVKARRDKIPLKNVVGVLEGNGPLAKETVVIGAHYDHLGYGGVSSLAGGKRMAIHPGADDNGSGTTALMELARRFVADPARQGRRLVFIAFSGEELGLYGSLHYCKNPLFPLADTVSMLNLDMVGRLSKDKATGKDKLLSEGHGTAKEYKDLIDRLAKKYDLTLSAKASGFGPSDHNSFCEKKIPVLFFWTGYHDDYHRPGDTADKINVPGMRRLVDLSQEVVVEMATVPKRPVFLEVKGSGGARPSSGPRLGFRPGYGEEEDGVLVEGVTENLPAARAGIKAGDKIVVVAGKPTKNLQTYMEVMAKQQKGTTIEIVVERSGKKLPLKVQLD
jgi:hypothetical protein